MQMKQIVDHFWIRTSAPGKPVINPEEMTGGGYHQKSPVISDMKRWCLLTFFI
jgi:hypothetical protein